MLCNYYIIEKLTLDYALRFEKAQTLMMVKSYS